MVVLYLMEFVWLTSILASALDSCLPISDISQSSVVDAKVGKTRTDTDMISVSLSCPIAAALGSILILLFVRQSIPLMLPCHWLGQLEMLLQYSCNPAIGVMSYLISGKYCFLNLKNDIIDLLSNVVDFL